MSRNELIKKLLDEKKANDIELIDLSGSDYFVDTVIIATITSNKQAYALIDELKILIKSIGESVLYEECSDDWSVLDLGDCLVHLMSEEYRKKYEFEKFLAEFKH